MDREVIAIHSTLNSGNRRARAVAALLIVAGLVGGFGWYAYRVVNRERLRPGLLGAARRGQSGEVRRLLAAGADPNARNYPAESLNLLELLKRLLRRPHFNPQDYDPVLVVAVTSHDVDSVDALIRGGADVNLRGAVEAVLWRWQQPTTSRRSFVACWRAGQ